MRDARSEWGSGSSWSSTLRTPAALVDITEENSVEHHSIDHPWYYGTDISVYPETACGIGRRLYELRKTVSVDSANGASSPVG